MVLGFNGFSYADVAAELGVTPASIHYHFPSKADLGVRLVERYTERFMAALDGIAGQKADVCDQLEAYAALYEGVLSGRSLCLCGMLAAEFETLPASVQERLSVFFALNEDWLTGVLERGAAEGDLDVQGDARGMAAAFTNALEGALVIGRVRGGLASFQATLRLLRQGLCTRDRA
jgi:TetR/AcrR family transcriptional regulator, transcriptional repressor for nem operon